MLRRGGAAVNPSPCPPLSERGGTQRALAELAELLRERLRKEAVRGVLGLIVAEGERAGLGRPAQLVPVPLGGEARERRSQRSYRRGRAALGE